MARARMGTLLARIASGRVESLPAAPLSGECDVHLNVTANYRWAGWTESQGL